VLGLMPAWSQGRYARPDVGALMAAAVLAYAGSMLWQLERRAAGTVALHLIAAAALGALVGAPRVEPAAAALPGSAAAGDAASAALLGSATVGMLFGHAYLTSPGLAIAHLVKVNRMFLAAGAIRTGTSAVLLFAAWPHLAGRLDGTTASWLALRWLTGGIAPLGLGVMVELILKHKNTQSATGVLFVAVVLAFIGETTAMLLYRELRFPL